ncbi:MAG: hypothetical protein ABI462_12195, partial [Ignavibacteria bacterium]
MSQKFTTSLLLVIMMFSFSLSYSRDKGNPIKATTVDGSEIAISNKNTALIQNQTDNFYAPLTTNTYVVNFTPLGLSSFYDLQSNGVTNEIWQNPISPDNVHAAVMVLPTFGGTRFVNYLLSTDRGQTWSLLGNVAESQSGFPSIDGYPDGKAVVAMHTTAGGVASARTQIFTDQGAGFGVFDRSDPGLNGTVSMIWARCLVTGNSTNPVAFVSSENAGTSLTGTNTVTSPTSFSGWQNYSDGSTAEQYALGLAQNGNVGHAYIEATDVGSVSFRESTDGGLAWGTSTQIFNADITADSLTAFRGISVVYLQNTPCVTFEVIHQTVADGVFPTLPCKIMFWSPAVNGGVAKEIAGENNIPFYPNSGPSTSYGVYFPLCRPSIGRTNDPASSMLFCAINATTDQIQTSDSNVYYATYLTVSYNGGNTWTAPERVTPTTPLKDYRYAGLSHTSSLKSSAPGAPWLVQGLVEVHDYAGAFAPSMPP